MSEIKEAYVEIQPDGKVWVKCPYCNHKIFPITEDVEIHNLIYKCKGSSCKGLMKVNIVAESR